MKRRTIGKLILTSNILFFSACSNTTPTIDTKNKKLQKPSLSAYSIMGIDRNRANHIPLFVVAKRAKSNFNIKIIKSRIKKNIKNIENIENIEDYPEATYVANIPKPVYEHITSYPSSTHSFPIVDTSIDDTSIENNSIEIISYGPTFTQNRNNYSDNIEIISYASTNDHTLREKHSFTQNSTSTVIKDEIEAKAKSFLGTRYVWGATGPSKFDCSGFTQWVYRDSGITIPRVSKDQAKVGNYVQYANLRRGDMVFFDTKKRRAGKVTHVGIYLGNNNFIHASSAAKKVIIYNFNDKPFYKERFLWGRRVINNNYLALK